MRQSVSPFERIRRSFYTPLVGICLVFRRVGNLLFVRVSVTHSVMESEGSFGGLWVSLKRPVLEAVSSFGRWGVSLTSPVLENVCLFVGGWGVWAGGGGGLFYTPVARVCQVFRWVGRLSFKPYSGIYSTGRWGVYFTNPVLASVSSFSEWRVSMTCPVRLGRIF